MSGHNALQDLANAVFEMRDPGDAKTIVPDRDRAICPVVTAAAETRTLAQPTKAGLECKIVLDVRVGDLTLTVTGGYNQAADTSIVFGTAGDWVQFHSVKVGTHYYWRVLSQEGTNVTPTTAASGSYTALTVGTLTLGATAVTATGAEINTLDRAGAAGVAEASKAVVLDAAKHLDEVNTASLKLGASGATVAVTATAAQLNTLAGASASIASVLAGGLGGAASYAKTDNGTKTLVAAHATKDRACLVVVYVSETFANGDTSQLILKIGEADTIEKCAAAATFTNAAAGTTFVFAFTNTATKAILATLTAAAGTGTGAASITVIAIPTT